MLTCLNTFRSISGAPCKAKKRAKIFLIKEEESSGEGGEGGGEVKTHTRPHSLPCSWEIIHLCDLEIPNEWMRERKRREKKRENEKGIEIKRETKKRQKKNREREKHST